MSRLQPLFIPFAGGANDQVDKRLLPNGVFAEVQNGRIPAAGSLRLRRGWRPLTMTHLTGGTLTARDLHAYGPNLVLCTSGLQLATFTSSEATRPWRLNEDGQLSPVTYFRRVGNIPELDANVVRASAAVTSDGVYGCVLQQTSTRSVVRVFNMTTDATIYFAELTNGSRVRKVVSSGTAFRMVENTGAALTLYTLVPTFTSPSFSLTATLLTATIDRFDVATAYDTTPTALHLATVDSTGKAEYRQFSVNGSAVGSAKTLEASDAKAITLCCRSDVTVHVVWQKLSDSSCQLNSFSATSPFADVAGPTALNGTATVVRDRFAVCDTGTQGIQVISERGSGSSDLLRAYVNVVSQTHTVNTANEQLGVQLFGGWLARSDFTAAGITQGAAADPRGGRVALYQAFGTLTQAAQPWCYTEFGLGAQDADSAHIPFWPGLAPTGDALVLTPIDRTPEAPSDTTPRLALVHGLRVATTERRPSVELANALYVTGGVLTQWTEGYSDVGMTPPSIAGLSTSNGAGALTLTGVYDYIAIMVWQDERGRTHRSALSPARRTTLAGAEDTVTATVYARKTLRRSANLITNPHIELYRTETGPGELFYLVGTAGVSSTSDSVTIVDTLADTEIVDNPLLVTQGEVGASSGILEMCPPRPSSYVAATKRRLWLGGADTSYQASQVQFPDTQIWFAEPGLVGDPAQAYFDDVEGGAITAVFALDEQVFVATAERIYVTGGAGPNLAGVGGEFAPPQRLPADVGVYDWRSVLEVGEGVWFRGSATRMYLLPRGAAQPTEQRAVQEHLTSALNIVGAGYDAADSVGVWALDNATALVRQTAIDLWASDTLPFTPIALMGHAGRLYAIASDGVVWAQDATAFGDGSAGAAASVLRVATGPVQVFDGTAGHGRLACVELMGEFQAAATVLGEISYDDGLTWTSLGSYSVTGLSVGETFQRQWYPARQRGGRFRIRFTMTPTVSTTEGCRLAGCVAYFTKASGQTRLGSANRK